MPDPDWTPYEALGDEGVARLVERFYHYMDTLPEAKTIRDMHGQDLAVMKDKLTVYFIGWMGGPREYTKRFGGVHIPDAHMRFAIGEAEQDAWLECMRRALQDVAPDQPEDFVEMLMKPITSMAQMCRTQ